GRYPATMCPPARPRHCGGMTTTAPDPRRPVGDQSPSSAHRRRGRLPALVTGTWSVAYLVLGIVWALGGPGNPFAGGSTPIPANSLLDQTPALVSGLTIAGIAVVMGILTLRLVRGRADRTTAGLAVATGLLLAV